MTTDTPINVQMEGSVAIVTMFRPPHNFVDKDFMGYLADTFDRLDADANCRAIVLASGIDTFCAGADFGASTDASVALDPTPFYAQALRVFRTIKPIVAAVRGPAIGAGLGLAVAADFRVTCKEARFSANFLRLGFHPGFGMSFTLPRLIGQQKAAMLFYTGRRIDGEEAASIGLADELTEKSCVDARALALAQEIATSAPLAVESTRNTLRLGFADQVVKANQREIAIQVEQFKSEDFREGVAAMAQRRMPVFQRR
jgi:enoyl-CoA hydratase/carnithine racemase